MDAPPKYLALCPETSEALGGAAALGSGQRSTEAKCREQMATGCLAVEQHTTQGHMVLLLSRAQDR